METKAESGLELIRAWAEDARHGDVSRPISAISNVFLRAAWEGVGTPTPSPELVDLAARGALRLDDMAILLREAVARTREGFGVWSLVGGVAGPGEPFSRDQRAPGGDAVVGLAVRVGSLVTIGAKRGRGADRYGAWVRPGSAWAELRQLGGRVKALGEFTRPSRVRLEDWAEFTQWDRVRMDLGTARAVALEVFARPFDAPGAS